MRNLKRAGSVIAIACMIFTMASCKKEDTSTIKPLVTTAEVAGSWKVTYYFDNSGGVSSDFDGYTFDFNDADLLIATNGTSTFTGTWVVQPSDDNPDFASEVQVIITGNTAMDELARKWLITDITSTTMNLKDDSGMEEIHFSKI